MRAALLILVLGLAGVYGKSCVDQYGIDDGNHTTCQCNALCEDHGDCCDDFVDVCKSCAGRCGEGYGHSKPCQCNDKCAAHGNCCNDYDQQCEGGGGGATDGELRAVTEQLLAADVNSVGSQVSVDDQSQTTSSSNADEAPLPLLTVPESALHGETFVALLALQDNYIAEVAFAEDDTPEELVEKDNFLDLIMTTDVMKVTETFMHDKGLINRPLREVLDEIWFTLYSRYGGILTSSGFEHSFVGELQGGKVSGFHNWVHFQNEEKNGFLDYKGWLKSPVSLGIAGELFMMRFDWLSEPKAIGSMWIGTSPELELAVYTICFYARPDALCPITMNGNNYHVQTWTLVSNGKTLVGSAYPDID